MFPDDYDGLGGGPASPLNMHFNMLQMLNSQKIVLSSKQSLSAELEINSMSIDNEREGGRADPLPAGK